MAKTSIKFRLSYLDKYGRRQLVYSDQSRLGITLALDGSVSIRKAGEKIFLSDVEIEQYTGCVDKKGVEIYVGDMLKSDISPGLMKVQFGYYRVSESLELPDGTIHTFNYSHVGFFIEKEDGGEIYQMSLAAAAGNLEIIKQYHE